MKNYFSIVMRKINKKNYKNNLNKKVNKKTTKPKIKDPNSPFAVLEKLL